MEAPMSEPKLRRAVPALRRARPEPNRAVPAPRRARPALRLVLLALCVPVLAGACGPDDDPEGDAAAQRDTGPQAEFFASLRQLCGNAYEGRVTEAPPGDTTFDQRLVMHVRECDEEVVRIPFHVGEDRSRTWLVTRLDDALRLKHDHRHEDGTPDDITMYGGDTDMYGTASHQEFPADEQTVSLVPAAAPNIWTLELVPGETFVYRLNRVGTDRRFRIEFDLTRPVAPPPPPWGAS
jgi:hypothetical protein